ncbi:PREDICTED: kynurenine/alpha-aminoadipate aminotransferase, mitochondrial [Nicrophorus vespilloides]|uniref:Kynurenine/alpha-aminoadipate aminotransferase, mitochondrial n=1 Tax=Nicrophorus vespilloides TaxID=110193 RepID=A0ABM1MKY1_NICVS|nr:PREDICTED: kynurenine/alpha-aminoadipate aminotransferase, mitochondrial [Nicrophorus vespilloides]
MDYSYFINTHSSRRRPAITRELTKKHYNAPKGAISLAEGMPNEMTFPFENINVNLKDGSTFSISGPELGASLQYIPTQGYPQLLQKLKEWTLFSHNPPNWDKREVLVTSGSQDGISRSIEMCISEGDAMLVQEPFYAGTEAVLKSFKPKLLAIEQDEYGMIPEVFVRVLENWKVKCDENNALRMPKLLYINPTASNPTGTTMSLERRKEIYSICCKYNILILEDDPYYFLNFSDKLTPSFLALDTEGRVLRFDSFSKVLCPGLRIGWLTGPKQLVQNVELHIQSSYLHSSTLSQVITYNLLNNWGFEKLLDHMSSVREYYKGRRDLTLAAMDEHLTGLCEWTVPDGGMFVWIKVKGISDVYDMLMTRGEKKLITFVPGHCFMSDPAAACNFIRASYSKAAPQQIEQAMKLLAELIREEKDLINKKLENFT